MLSQVIHGNADLIIGAALVPGKWPSGGLGRRPGNMNWQLRPFFFKKKQDSEGVVKNLNVGSFNPGRGGGWF